MYVTTFPFVTEVVPAGDIVSAALTAIESGALVVGARFPFPAKTDWTVEENVGVTVSVATPAAFVTALPNVVHVGCSAFVPWNVIVWPPAPVPAG